MSSLPPPEYTQRSSLPTESNQRERVVDISDEDTCQLSLSDSVITSITVVAPHDGVGPPPLLPSKPKAIDESNLLKGQIAEPENTKKGYKGALVKANKRIVALEKHYRELHRTAVFTHVQCNHAVVHQQKALVAKQKDLLKVVEKNNNLLNSICHDKLKINSLTAMLSRREKKIELLTKRVEDLSITLAINKTTGNSRERDIMEMEKVEHKARVSLQQEKGKLALHAQADELRSQRKMKEKKLSCAGSNRK